MPAGRPTIYTQELADRICQLVCTHDMGMEKICNLYPDLPGKTTIWNWMLSRPEFREQYVKAKDFREIVLEDGMLTIADGDGTDITYFDDGSKRVNNEAVNRDRLRVDTRKYLLERLRLKKSQDQNTSLTVVEQLIDRLVDR